MQCTAESQKHEGGYEEIETDTTVNPHPANHAIGHQ